MRKTIVKQKRIPGHRSSPLQRNAIPILPCQATFDHPVEEKRRIINKWKKEKKERKESDLFAEPRILRTLRFKERKKTTA
jgi:hypothetical protein